MITRTTRRHALVLGTVSGLSLLACRPKENGATDALRDASAEVTPSASGSVNAAPTVAGADASAPEGGTKRQDLAAQYEVKIFAPSLTDGRIDGFERTMRDVRPRLHECYVTALVDGQAWGTLTVTAKIDARGRATSARIAADKDARIPASLAACLVAAFEATTFSPWPDKPSASVTLVVPLELDRNDVSKYAMQNLVNGLPEDAGNPTKDRHTQVHVRELTSTTTIEDLDVAARHVAESVRSCVNASSREPLEGELSLTIDRTESGERRLTLAPGKGLRLPERALACIERSAKSAPLEKARGAGKVKLTIALERAPALL